jgi:aspartate aminotransferase
MFAKRISNLEGSKTKKYKRKVAELKSKGIKVIDFGHGDTNFQVSNELSTQMKNFIEKGRYKYSSSKGTDELRNALAKKHSVDKENVLIGAGAKHLLDLTSRLIYDRNDNIIVISPNWPTYNTQIKIQNAQPQIFSLDEKLGFDPEKFMQFANSIGKIKAIILNNPNNPTGRVYSKEEIRGIINVAKKFDAQVISDEVYSEFTFNNKKMHSILDFGTSESYLQNVIYINSASKNYGMSGFRIGYLISNKQFVEKASQLISQTYSNVPEFIQLAYLHELNNTTHHKTLIEKMKNRYKTAIDTLAQCKNLKLVNSNGAIYLFPKIVNQSKTFSDTRFAEFLIDKYHISVLPGSSFNRKHHLRLAIGKSNPETIMEGVNKIDEAVNISKK